MVHAKPMRMLAVAAVAALVAGCGGSGRLSKAQYEQRIQADGKAAQQAVTKAAGGLSSPASLATQIAAAQQAVKKAADDLDAAKPPKDAEADNHTIVVGLRTIETELGRLEGAAKKHDIAALQSGAAALQAAPEIKAAQRAANDLKQKGYKIGVLGQSGG